MSFAKHTLPGGLGINATHAFSVVDPPGFKQPEVARLRRLRRRRRPMPRAAERAPPGHAPRRAPKPRWLVASRWRRVHTAKEPRLASAPHGRLGPCGRKACGDYRCEREEADHYHLARRLAEGRHGVGNQSHGYCKRYIFGPCSHRRCSECQVRGGARGRGHCQG